MAISVDVIPNRSSPPAILLREAWREGPRIRRRTIANLSKMPPEFVDAIRSVIKGGVVHGSLEEAVSIRRALPHGHAAAALGTARRIGLERILHRSRSRKRDLALAAIAARIIAPDSKLATARRLSPETADSSLGSMLGLGQVSGNEMLDMLDWLRQRQPWIEKSLANRHLGNGTLILYDVSSSYVEGRCCPLAAFGHNRDGKKGKKQITFGLLCATDGCPVAVEVFSGNTADPSTVALQIAKLRSRFGITRLALVGDRGMITTARIREDLEPAGLDWISALRNADIRRLLRPSGGDAPLDPDALVADAVAEIASPDFPGERLMVCLNPRLRQERERKREDLLRATETELQGIAETAARNRPGPSNRDRINRSLGARGNRRKVLKHFDITVGEDSMTFRRNAAGIRAEAALDGIYVVRTNLPTDAIGAEEAVEAYKNLSRVERGFRHMKTDLRVRPIHVRTGEHVRGHVFLCMLSHYVEWHMRRRLAPLLFQDDDPEGARAQRSPPVGKAEVSDRAKRKADTLFTPEGFPVHGMTTLLADLGTLTLNEVCLPSSPDHAFTMTAQPTPVQKRAFELLDLDPERDVAMQMAG